MTLNGLVALILRYFTEFGSFRAYCVKVYVYYVVVKKFTFVVSSADEFLIMAALCNRAGHYIFALWFLSILFFYLFSSPNLSGRKLDVYDTSTHAVALVRI